MATAPANIPLSASQRAKVRRLSQPKELSPDEGGGELNIVPFLDIIVNILIFVLATVAVTFTATIDTTPPAQGGAGIDNGRGVDARGAHRRITPSGPAWP